ncbi:MAG: DUF4365 domain-containing protein [Chloroflexaceae bacterium]|nr:DUF4365 domain-containing protein [Chloroflexaceae bacterium]
MLPKQHTEEEISRVHIQVIAAQAGVNIDYPNRDYGIDGTFQPIAVLDKRYVAAGYPLDFLLKASTQSNARSEVIVYDLEVKTYNDLVQRRLRTGATPCILVLKVLPLDQHQWLETSEEGLLIRCACYWEYLEGKPSANLKTVRIAIPRTQQLTPASLSNLLNLIEKGEWPCQNSIQKDLDN